MAKQIPASNRVVGAGDNELITPDILQISHATLEKRLAALELIADRVPEITSDEASGPWQEIIGDLDTLGYDIEATRVQVKGPFERAVEHVNGYFFALHAPRKGQTPGRLQRARAKVAGEVLAYLGRKEARARAEREETARKAREEQEAALERFRKAETQRLAAEEEGRKRAASNAAVRAAEAEADAHNANARAFEATQEAQAKPAELARVRSEGGKLATPVVEWDFAILDLEAIKGAPLWKFVPRSGKEAAIRAYIRANAPKVLAEGQDWQPLAGVQILCKRGLQNR